MAQSAPRSSGRHKAATRQSYREPDTDTEFEYEELTKPRSRPARSSQRLLTYRESSTSSDEDSTTVADSDLVSASEQPPHRAATKSNARNTTVRKSRRNKSTKAKRIAIPTRPSLSTFKRQKVSHIGQAGGKTTKEWFDKVIIPPANIQAPPWQTLEYQILVKIMQYAAYPLYSSAFRGRSTIEWLVGVSRLSKSFHDAAVAALLWQPPLLPTFRAHGLIGVLSRDQEHLSTNYRTKIRSLNIEVKHILVKKSGIGIEELLRYTPMLSHLRIFHGHDEMIGKAIWAEPTMAHFKWSYGKLFDYLDDNHIRLKSFEWNGRFQDTMAQMATAHQRPSMSCLEEVSIVNLNFSDKQEAERLQTRDSVVSALSSLPNLKSLEFRNCTVVDATAMSLLPMGLKSLKIVNCLSLTSEGVERYLTLGGLSVHTLHLEGNQVMDLAFMPNLADLCPHLEDLYIDLSYEDCSSYRDRNPLYDDLLPNGSPSWPASLTSIVIGPLRSLDMSDAEEFYGSLINAAGSLPYLRVLNIKTLLKDASWRDRANLRKKWRPLFEKVFNANKSYVPTTTTPKPERRKETQRKSARLQELDEVSVSEEAEISDCSLPSGVSTLSRQNRCEVLVFELSDQRPAQEQFREADFLDSEPSGDDEWNGQDERGTGNGYAW